MNNDHINAQDAFDHSTHKEFVDYYAKESLSDSSINRMKGIFNCINRNLESRGINQKLNIADIGCGAGVMSIMWAQEGHKVYGLDVNETLLGLAKQRANEADLNIAFNLGSATNLPWESRMECSLLVRPTNYARNSRNSICLFIAGILVP